MFYLSSRCGGGLLYFLSRIIIARILGPRAVVSRSECIHMAEKNLKRKIKLPEYKVNYRRCKNAALMFLF